MNAIPSTREHLSVQDDRGDYAALSLAISAESASDQGWSPARLQEQLTSVVQSDAVEPWIVEHQWSPGAQIHRFQLVVPNAQAQRWSIEALYPVLNALPSTVPVVLAQAGAAASIEAVSELAEQFPGVALPLPEPTRSMLSQRREAGYEQSTITGADPAGTIGSAATFAALCAVMAAGAPDVQAALKAAGDPSQVALSRRTQQGSPSIEWTVITRAESSLQALDLVLEVLTVMAQRAQAAPEHILRFAYANLCRAWLSPTSLVGTLAEYAAMGWGGELIQDPALVRNVSGAELAQALGQLGRPIREVLGYPER
ncbi:hypothetical protein [Glutamicibacter endophyticus]|uniref:hypothetical protein n=1 Tax=Glutamicibacter endophyticus TaxID=1522174 RepID=UPI003AF1720A